MNDTDKCECSLSKRLTGDGCEFCNPEMAERIERENDLDEHRTAFNVATDQLWMAAREGEDTETLSRRLETAKNRLYDLQWIEKLAGVVC